MSSQEYKNGLFNAVYTNALVMGVVIGYSHLLKRFLRINIGSPSEAGLEDGFKLWVVLIVTAFTLKYFQEQGILPPDIIKNN